MMSIASTCLPGLTTCRRVLLVVLCAFTYSPQPKMRATRKSRKMLYMRVLVQRARDVSAVNALRIAWVAAVAWYELGIFYWSVAHCAWPDEAFAFDEGSKIKDSVQTPAHILLIADPQVLDMNSYPERGYFLGLLSQVIVDLNMRKSWWAVRRLLLTRNQEHGDNDDVVVFLGDMMDNGRNPYDDAEYESYFARFKSIFSTEASTKAYFIAGNHDVGLGSSQSFSPKSRSRYIKHFGPLNYKISFGNHTLVMLDAPGLVEEDYRRSSAGQRFEDWKPRAGGVIEFVNEFASVGSQEPVVLFSHIPLFRPDTTNCGPLRERGTIRRGVGFGYQNTLGRQTSEYILKSIRPSVIFSGDDHDYCEYIHSVPLVSEGSEPKIEYVREVTVKSFSMAMGIHNPGFQLLSLASPSSITPGSPSYADVPCFLPDQLAIYVSRYIPLLMLSLCVLAVSTFRRLHDKRGRGGELIFDIDPNDVSLASTSPESVFPGPLSSARMPMSASGNRGLAPAYRASSAVFPGTPYTPEFTTTPGGRLGTPNLLSAPQTGLGILPGDIELGYVPRGDEVDDQESQYAERRMYDDAFYAPTLGRAPTRRRRLAWSWTFVLGGRRRRLTIGVPPLLERLFFRLVGLLRPGSSDQGMLGGDRGGNKRRSYYSTKRESAGMVFIDDVLATAWPPVLAFVLLNLYMFR